MEELCKNVIDVINESKLQQLVEYTGRESFKIKVASFSQFPQHVVEGLKTLKKISSTFGGKKGQKVTFLKLGLKLIFINKGCVLVRVSYVRGDFSALHAARKK